MLRSRIKLPGMLKLESISAFIAAASDPQGGPMVCLIPPGDDQVEGDLRCMESPASGGQR
jgi:hypothetical protein